MKPQTLTLSAAMPVSRATAARRILILGTALAIAAHIPHARASEPASTDYGSGMMLTAGKNGTEIPMPLKHTDVQAKVSGLVAAVEVTQTFINPGDETIEAVYVFPLPNRAAIFAMDMIIGDRKIKGIIKKREDARKIYDDAKAAGKTASLLDQERPNVFTQSVANIRPGDEVEVKIRYVENLAYEKGAYEFVFPMVVGPRYMGGMPTGKSGTGWSPDTTLTPDASRISPPVLPDGRLPKNRISLRLAVDAGMPILDLETPSHAIKLVEGGKSGGSRTVVELDTTDNLPNKDFILRYKLAGAAPQAAVLSQWDDGQGGHFLLMLQPQDMETSKPQAEREYYYVVDTSGSMSGEPLEQVKRVFRKLSAGMTSRDAFQVITFAGTSEQAFKAPVQATEANIKRAVKYIEGFSGGGGTEFLPALEMALKTPKTPGRSRIIMWMTDGYVGYENEIFKFVRTHLGDANIFVMGVGSSVNRHLLDGMARLGMGEPLYIRPDEDAAAPVDKFYKYVSRPALTGIEVQVDGVTVTDTSPHALPDLFADRPLFLTGRYQKGGRAVFTVRGNLGGANYFDRVTADLATEPTGHSAVPYLWARRAIDDQMDALNLDGKQDAKEKVIELAMRYNLMSQFTSLVAVDDIVRGPAGTKTVNQPVMLPEFVTMNAAPPHAYASGTGVGGGGYGAMGAQPAKARMKGYYGGAAAAEAVMEESEKWEGQRDRADAPGADEDSLLKLEAGPAPADKKAWSQQAPASPPVSTVKPKDNKTAIQVRIGAEIRGAFVEGFTPQALRAALEKHTGTLKACYESHGQAGQRGVLRVLLTIGLDGKIIKAAIVFRAFENAAINACLEAALKGLDATAGATLPAQLTLNVPVEFGL